MSLLGLNEVKCKRSLELSKELIETIREKFDMNFGYSYNDLYKVKGGVVRRLKGGIWRVDDGIVNSKEYNIKFNEIKEFIDNLDIEGFDIKLNKLKNYGWSDYYLVKERGFEGTFEDYKNKSIFEETGLILKIRWDV